MSLLQKRLKKNIINKEINKTIDSLTTKEQETRKEKQVVKFMSLNQYLEALPKDFPEFVKNDIDNRVKALSGSPQEMSKKMNEFVLILDLLRNVKQEIGTSKLALGKKKEYSSLISDNQKKILQLTNQVLEYRRLASLEQEFINKQVVSVALKNIQEKHLVFLTNDTSTLEANLKVILNEIHIVLLDQLYKEDKTIVQYKKDDKNSNRKIKYIQYPHPKQFWNSTNIEINLENAESQIHNISQYMELLSELKALIKKLPNRQRISQLTKTSEKTLSKIVESKQDFQKILDKLIKVVDDATHKFIRVLMNPYFELIKSQPKETTNYFLNPYIKQNDEMVYVYDIIHEFSSIIRDERESNGALYMFEAMYHMMVDNINMFEGQGGRLERVKMINWISQIEEKYKKDYFKLKKAIAIDQFIERIVLEKKNEKSFNISLADILKGMPKPKKVNVEKEVRKLIKDLKKDSWQSIRKQILTITWNLRKNEIPLSWYKTLANPSALDYMIVYFTGFFQQYNNIYGSYPFEISQDSLAKFREWTKKRIDNGKFLNKWVQHYIDLNNRKFLFFNKETGLLDVNMEKARFFIQDMGNDVRQAYDDAVRLLDMAKGNTEINMNLNKCRHEEIDQEIAELIKMDGTEEQLRALEEERVQCHLQTEEGIICKSCGVKLDVILDSLPESYDEMERRRLNQQAEDMEVGYQELQRKELEKKMMILIDEYMNGLVDKTKVSVKTVVSNLKESRDISRQEVDKIKRELLMIIMSNERNIFNSVQSVYKKNMIVQVDNQSIKYQIMNDLVKMLLIMYFVRKFPNITENGTTKEIQQIFNDLPSLSTSVTREAFKFQFRLNYVIKIYNQAVGIYNNSEQDQFEQDETEILESELDNLQGEELEIVTASFGISKSSQATMIKEIKQKQNEEKKQEITETDEIVDKMILNAMDLYNENLQKVFGLSSSLYNQQIESDLFSAIVAKTLGKEINTSLNFKEYQKIFLNLFYWSRNENETNPSFQDYKEKNERLYHQDISNIELLKHQKQLFLDRYSQVKQLMKYLQVLLDLLKIDLSDIDMKYMFMNQKAFIKGKRSLVEVNKNFVLLISSLFHDGSRISLVLLNGLLNDKTFKSKIQTLKQYEEEFKTNLQKVQDEMKELNQIDELNNKYNKTIFLCPICSFSSALNLDVALHVRKAHNFYVSDKLEVIEPIGNKCPYCPYKGNKINQHLKQVHLKLEKSKELYKIGMENRYQSHLRNLWRQHGIGESTDRKMKNLDNKMNMLELYQEYCDQNFENNLKRHFFLGNKCEYCKRTRTQITKDGMNVQKASEHAKTMKDYIDSLDKRYCLSNNFKDIHKNTNCSLKDFTALVPLEEQWHLLRKNKFIEKVVVDSIIRKIDLYKRSLVQQFNQVYPNGDLRNAKLDIIDQLHDVEIINRGYLEPYDGLEAIYGKYKSISEKTLKQIFKTKDILKWDKTIKVIENADGNKTIKEGKKQIRNKIIANVKDWLEKNQGDLKEFENLVGKKLPMMKMEKYDEENIKELKGDRTKRLIKVVRNVILDLSKLNNGLLNPYMHNTYLLSQKKQTQSGGSEVKRYQFLQAPLDLYVGGKFDGSQFRGLLVQAPLDLYKGGDPFKGILVERPDALIERMQSGGDAFKGVVFQEPLYVYHKGGALPLVAATVGMKMATNPMMRNVAMNLINSNKDEILNQGQQFLKQQGEQLMVENPDLVSQGQQFLNRQQNRFQQKQIGFGKDMYHGLPVTNVQVYDQGPEISQIDGLVRGGDVRGNDVYRGLVVIPQNVYRMPIMSVGGNSEDCEMPIIDDVRGPDVFRGLVTSGTSEVYDNVGAAQDGGSIIVQEALNVYEGKGGKSLEQELPNDVNVLNDIRDSSFMEPEIVEQNGGDCGGVCTI